MAPKRNRVLIAAIAYTALVTVLCALPGRDLPHAGWMQGLHLDKIVHFSFYLGFAVLWSSAIGRPNRHARRFALMVFLAATAYGIVIEILQGALWTSRSAEAADAIANSLGALAGVLLYPRLVKVLKWFGLSGT